VSHRIAGPLFKLEQLLRLIGQGDLTVECHFRKNDELAGLGDALNEMNAALRDRVGRLALEEFKLE
jgi:methyl-accepting chemotaxis protein